MSINELFLTIFITLALMLLAFAGLAFGVYAGRKKRSRCACKAAEQVMNQIEKRKKNAKQKDNTKSLDIKNLPIVEKE